MLKYLFTINYEKNLSFFNIFFFASAVYSQVGIDTKSPKATLDVVAKATDTNIPDGIIAPRLTGNQLKAKDNTYTEAQNATIVYATSSVSGTPAGKTINVTNSGYYYYHQPTAADAGVWIAFSSTTTNTPFFYMPSVSLPTNPADSRVTDTGNTNFTFATDTYTVNLYNLFSAQFNTPKAYSNTADGLTGFVLTSNKYDYFVTFSDDAVFTNIAVSASGVLTYKVTENAVVKNGSFMNIVLKVKQ